MIISYRNRFVFIHIAKNAGMFVASRLQDQLGFNGVAINGPRVHIRGNPVRQFLCNRRRAGTGAATGGGAVAGRPELLRKHAFSSEIRRALPAYDRYRRFCVVRNPFDRAVSQYHYIKGFNGELMNRDLQRMFREIQGMSGFGEYARHGLVDLVGEHFFAPQARYIEGDDDVDIVHFEDIAAELERLLAGYGLGGGSPEVPVNASRRERDYRAYFDEDSIAAIETVYGEDLRRFGYAFER